MEKNHLTPLTKEEFSQIRDFVMDEERSWPRVQQLRAEFETSWQTYVNTLPIHATADASASGFMVISAILFILKDVMDLDTVDPGHGVGHLMRDYLHASLLTQFLDVDHRHAYIGFVSGTLHDFLGCTLIDRYAEGHRAVRHAEAGGLLFLEISERIGLSHEEAVLIYYAIAAHTNYLRPVQITSAVDNMVREIVPYMDTDTDGHPLMLVHLSRWTDRLDVNGPCFVGRHYLTMADEHHDYAELGGHKFFSLFGPKVAQWTSTRFGVGKHYKVTYAEHMRPLLRDRSVIAKDPTGNTMREHLAMFANSQNNESPFGRFDYGYMTTLRDMYKEHFFRILDAFEHPMKLSENEATLLLTRWTSWLYMHIEPTRPGKEAAEKLQSLFFALPDDVKGIWYNVMTVTLHEYELWAGSMRKNLALLTEKRLVLPVLQDVRKII